MQDENNILNVLNEDCFMEIFSYLPLDQLVVSERVSKQWNYLVHERYKRVYTFRTSDWDGKPLMADTLQSLLKKFGYYLRILQLNLYPRFKIDHEVIKMICEYCTELVNLNISWLIELDSNDPLAITDKSISLVWSLKKLEYLNMSGIDACDSFMELGKDKKGSKLKQLLIRDNYMLSDEAVCHLITACPDIKSLDLYECVCLTDCLRTKIISILHSDVSQSACVPGRITLNFSERIEFNEQYSENTCKCLNINHEEKYRSRTRAIIYEGYVNVEDSDSEEYDSEQDLYDPI